MEEGDIITISIDGFGSHGEGVGRLFGKAIFVDGALPGETVEAALQEERKNHGFAKLLRVIKPSPFRVTPVCPLFGTCGGCQIMHLSYEKQLEMKQQKVVSALTRIGKLTSCEVAPCIASPSPLAYRNKIQLPFREGPILGLYAKSSHIVIPVDHCFIHSALGEAVFQKLKPLLAKVKTELRHVLIKSAIRTQEVLLVLVTERKEISLELQEAAFKIQANIPEVKGVIQNVQPLQTNKILGTSFHCLYGKDKIEEVLCGLKFSISAASFFQVNPMQAEKLYEFVLASSQIEGNEVVVDAYCGVGTLALIFAKHVKKAIGIECVPHAIDDAKANSEKNGIANALFICGQAEKHLSKIEKIDILLLNPPRKGCDPTIFSAISRKKPQKIIYVSCDPATLARDLSTLEKMGYKIDLIQPFDMFPQTAHVETVAKLDYLCDNYAK